MNLETIESHVSHDGVQGIFRHKSLSTGTDMSFSVFVPTHPPGATLPVVWFLSGLTCTPYNVTEKGEYRAACAEHGLIFVAPDTSPRGEGVPDDSEAAFDFGLGAGFYIDATRAPFDQHYRMWSYVTEELPALIGAHFPVDMRRQSIMGHSMGGHGALTIGLSYPERFRAISAFAPIVAPSQAPWGQKAFRGYFGDDLASWRRHDAVALIEAGARAKHLLVDQGDADPWLDLQLKPDLLRAACEAAGIDLRLNIRAGYDHGFYFVSSFLREQLAWHAKALNA